MSDIDTGLKTHPIHRALSRPNLLFGADRELVLLTGLVCVILIFVVITVSAALLGITAWTLIVAILRTMAKSDPQLRKVYLRHIRHQAVYRATSSAFTLR
ncbi:MAG: conjugal transfer protein TrbD [Rhizobiaceae bacterium]|jgi:type IV secretion system protein VirB3|nr:conjugal transfer protein TrbD [Rhizobiaceae bacterium]MCZ8351766.1 conjugal transfer protein TrbD [Rhizobium sp.]